MGLCLVILKVLSKYFKILFLVAIIFSYNSFVYADIDLEAGGHLKLKGSVVDFNSGSAQEQIGPKTGNLQDYNFRLNLKAAVSDFNFQLQAESNGVGGS